MRSILIKFVFRIIGGRKLSFNFLGQWICLRKAHFYYLCFWFYSKKSELGVREIEHLFVSGVIRAIRKRGDLKISLSNSRGGKILSSTTSGSE